MRKFFTRFGKSEAAVAWLFMTPGLILLALFVFWPIIYSVPLALTNYSVIGKTEFVGLDNFVKALQDKSFITSLLNSLLYVIVVPFIQIISILMAILVNSNVKGIKLFRTAYYIPVVTSMVAVALIWGWLLNQNGVINYVLSNVGLMKEKITWLSDKDTALWTLMFITMWKGLGYYMMIYLAGLQSVPKDLTEAAMIDGASRAQTIRKITIPLLRPYVFFCTLISLMAAIRVFDEVFILTMGGPGDATLTSSLYIYQQGFQQFNFGYSSALGLIVSVMIGALSIVIFRFNRKGGVNPY
ncbi:sugar ABC transporter permease [Paenibacillus sp. MER 180]|uniref:Sugar ABC transporter permease n=2 Tax=Paenibacillus TaxID=44249 RepID=A0ABT4E6K2_PAEAL|nr:MULTISPECIES: sugar ABC transporter permease [Paenibacillus]EPY14153.1 sugar ABC transporter permease [Paenibacillus alvei A6-6i-x]MCM3293272.1 sugar ABC transporter permease [Paenibacillus sp. MER 180]MCY9529352.1 sugar ABC transporter permease [Paenibacillus alvei]OBY78139.1 lactose ABC transporter permease [Paenibacillus sp. KS1]TQR41715.1 sugar ABC transporter permease [Paenibacillus sp. SDF0028]